MKGVVAQYIKKGVLLILTIFVSVGMLGTPSSVFAVDAPPPPAGPGIPITVTGDAPRFTEWLLNTLKTIGENALLTSLATGLINTMTFAADRLAYDAAVFIASGGDGGDPLFENRSIGEYFSDYGASVAADALGQIDDSGLLGNFSLCDPDVTVTLAFKFGLQSAFQRPEPSCDYKKVGENWKGFIADVQTTLTDPKAKNSLILTELANAYNPKENDFSVGILLYTDVLTKAQQDASLEAQRTLFGGFFKEKTNFITGRVETPAEILQNKFNSAIALPDEISKEVALQTLGDNKVLMQLGIHAGSVFTNTLLSKFTEKIYSGIFGNLDQTDINPFDSYSFSLGNDSDARDTYRSFLTARILSIENYSLLDDFSACPYQGKGLYNCVADASLVSAIARADGGAAMTIAEAIEDGLLRESWPLISSEDSARNQDIYCYTYGYCHGNLVKLRKARVISVGWELAAESSANSVGSPVTLGEVVDGFYDCNDQNELDDNHPWCHLIDPNWVLKYPETQCRNQAYGEILESSVSDQRKQECVDMPSCIDEDGSGNCTGGYGYCVREENVWDFRGEECPDYYGSCTSYEMPDGTDVNFLSNTTDSSVCAGDSVGCLRYETQKIVADDSSVNWPDYSDSADFAAADAAEDAYRNRIYFTALVEDCAAEDAGCRELVGREDGTTLNMVTNPSFELDNNDDAIPDGWTASALPSTSTSDVLALDGAVAVNPNGLYTYTQSGLVLTQSAEYSFSFYAAQNDATATANVALDLSASTGESVDLRGYSMNGDCSVDSGDTSRIILSGTPTGVDFVRYSCTFTAPTMASASSELWAAIVIGGGNIWIDSVQFEQEVTPSAFHVGYSNPVLDLSYVKVAPTYLGCTGSSSDPAECSNYAGVCSQTDVGCSLYTPSNGDPSVTGIAGSLDACPSVCAGYDTFKQEPTLYEPIGDFPVYLIPDSADTCSQQYVGCDEFTNISTEEQEYFTYVRACVTPDQARANTSSDNAAVFYTWEGSDTDGYQLKTWNLIESDMGSTPYVYASGVGSDTSPNSAPCTSWSATDEGITCNDDAISGGTLDSDTTSCDEHADTITNPDCREFYDTDGVIHYREWTSTVTVNNTCVTYRKTDLVGLGDDLDGSGVDDGKENCEDSGGFFDDATNVCRYYGYAEESIVCPVTQSGCREYTGGRSRNSRQAFVEYFEEGNISNWDASSASDVTLSNESLATDGHSLYSNGNAVWTYVGGDGTECTSEEGCTPTEGALGGTCFLSSGEEYCGTLSEDLYTGKTYTLSFWAKGSGTLSVGFDTSKTSGTPAMNASFASGDSAITLDTDWHEYAFGPLNMAASEYPDFGTGSSTLVFTPGSGTAFYIDNVVLREGEDNITVIKDSWVTPASCDQTAEGASSPQYMLGCQEYTDQNGESAYLKSFSSLCDESKVGCSAYFMTQESDSTGAAVYGAECSTIDGATVSTATSCYFGQNSTSTGYDTTSEYLCTIGAGQSTCEFNIDWYATADVLPSHISYSASTVISPADKDIFLVVNGDVECSSDVAGCMEVGLPTYSQDHTAIESWTSTYLMNLPDDYGDTLCSQDELFCNAWTDNTNSTSYFKNPQDQTCEYRTDVTVDNVTYDGWFKTDTDELCDPDYVIGGDLAGIWRNGDDEYGGWVGTCEAKYDTCSEFQDVSDLETDELYALNDGTSYYYLNNDSLEENSLPDSQKCNGEVSQTNGCGLFNDSSNPSQTSNASATYVASTNADYLFGAQQNDFVDPIDCSSDSSITTPSGTEVDLCANRCWYSADEFYDINGSDESYVYDGSCYSNTDCRPLTSESGATVTGFCASSYAGVTAPRLENDSNIVLKVNRDRECSQWLACSDTQTTWDERTGSYVTICGDIGLCTAYSGAGDASFCSAWRTGDPAVVLTTDVYSSRDVTWYGEDYSGYAIPELLPVDQLTQVNVAKPYTCETLDSSRTTYLDHHGDPCATDLDCGGTTSTNEYCTGTNSESDYRLGYVAGSCEGLNYGSTCSVGYCENTGSPCATTESCGVDGGTCVVGTCYTVSSTLCASSADCATGESCLGGFCATDEGYLSRESYSPTTATIACGSGQTFYPSVNLKSGLCMYDQCVLTAEGGQFDSAKAEEKTCRVYPEINSPFANDIVTLWYDPTDSEEFTSATGVTNENADAAPFSYVQNFENVKTCALGEDCDCSYQKITYQNEAIVRYYAQNSDIENITSTQGVCSSGKTGAFCEEDTDCGADAVSGACSFPAKVDEVLGLDGYCLERDSATNILGNRDKNACLTWLPVDQLLGSTDLYAKYTEAGYFEETNYCAYVSTFADLKTSNAIAPDGEDKWTFSKGAEILCAGATTTSSTGADQYCLSGDWSLQCPAGYFAVVGPKWDGSEYDGDEGKDTFTYTCSKDGSRNDCPYICVPKGARNTETGELCSPAGSMEQLDDQPGFNYEHPGVTTSYEYTVPVYVTSNAYTFTNYALEAYESCVGYGRQLTNNEGSTIPLVATVIDHGEALISAGYAFGAQDSKGQASVYAACSTVFSTALSEKDNGAAPYTDRILNTSGTEFSLNSATTSEVYYRPQNFKYTKSTLQTPFGSTLSPDAMNAENDPRPFILPSCVTRTEDSSTAVTQSIFFAPGVNLACDEGVEDGKSDFSDPEGRALTDYYLTVGRLSEILRTGTNMTPGRVHQISTAAYVVAGPGTPDCLQDAGDSDSGRCGVGLIEEVFARGRGGKQFYDGIYDPDSDSILSSGWNTGEYKDITTEDGRFEYDVRADEGNRPSIWALELGKCYNGKCEEDPDHPMTVNDQNEGDIYSNYFYRAYLKFYAAADKNQLPIRRVIVDWGDGSDVTGSTSDDNYYKNHRGLEEGTETSICEKSGDSDFEWGMSPESCDSNYFTYSHIYTCNPAGLTSCSDVDGDGIPDNTPCTNDGGESCTFRPAVHIRDNWGLCTGVCDNASSSINADGTANCVDMGTAGEMNNSENSNECNYNKYTSNSDLNYDTNYTTVPWVKYDGTITVTP